MLCKKTISPTAKKQFKTANRKFFLLQFALTLIVLFFSWQQDIQANFIEYSSGQNYQPIDSYKHSFCIKDCIA